MVSGHRDLGKCVANHPCVSMLIDKIILNVQALPAQCQYSTAVVHRRRISNIVVSSN